MKKDGYGKSIDLWGYKNRISSGTTDMEPLIWVNGASGTDRSGLHSTPIPPSCY
jgi:hypothetical protein